jgi:transcriptional regulator GlxA family with amidase domain
MNDSPRHFAFVLIPRFTMLSLSCALDGLRCANVDCRPGSYSWELISAETGLVVSSSEVPLSVVPLREAKKPDVVVICGGERSHEYFNVELTNWLHATAKTNIPIGSVSDGAFVAAEAGLFNGHRSTIHWKCLDAYAERFPKLDIRSSIIEIDRNRFSCAGGTPCLDLMLHFILHDLGSDAVAKIANNYFHDTIGEDRQTQHLASAFRFAGHSQSLTKALLMMENNLEHPIRIAEIAEQLKISHRQLDRLFQKFLQASPAQYFRSLRLARAAGLLSQTGLNISEIAFGCGFQSSSHLGRYFKDQYGVTPGTYRKSLTLVRGI